MPHTLIVGRTLSGKTTLATQLINNETYRAGRPAIILDPNLDNRWPKDESCFVTHDKDVFLRVVKDPQNYSAVVVVDESGEKIGRYGGEMSWLATRGRHYGHQCLFITQRATQLDKNVRTQCANLFIFRQAASDAKVLDAEWADGSGVILSAAQLNQGEYIACIGFNPPQKLKLTF